MSGSDWHLLEGLNPDGASFPARAAFDGHEVLVFRLEDGFRAVQRSCPHRQANLREAVILGGGSMLRCPFHGYTFRLSDGKGVNCPGYKLAVYEVSREADKLFARVAT